MTIDIYQEVKRYIAKLKDAGFLSYAERIQNATLGGCTSGEIMGNVALELKNARNGLGLDQNFLIAKADTLLVEVAAILK